MNKNKSKANIIIHFEKSCFYLGEFIKGNIEINTNSSALIKDVTIEIFEKEDWKIKDGDSNKSDNYNTRVVFYKLDLKNIYNLRKIDDEQMLLPVGITFIPFNFRFSEDNIPCFEYPLPERRAYIRYNFVVNLISTNINGTASTLLYLLSRPIIDSEKKLSMSIKQKIKKWKLFGEGDTILNVNVPENNFKYDSFCRLNIEIDNTKGKINTKELKITLIRTIYFKNKNGEIKYKDEKKIVREKIKAEVKKGAKNKFDFNLSLKEKDTNKIYNYNSQINPYNIDLQKINFFMPTVKGKLISCDYTIKICLYFERFVDVKHRPRVFIPIYLVHQLPVDYQLEIQEQIEIENALKLSKNENPKKNVPNSYNVNNNHTYNLYNDYNNNFEDNQNQNNLEQNNIEEEPQRNSLPSLELIEDAHRERILKENNKNNDLNQNNKIDINEIDSYQPDEDVNAPAPFDTNQNIINNKDNYNINDYDNNIYQNINEDKMNNINYNNNELRNQSNYCQNEGNNLFNYDNKEQSNLNKYEDINAI